MNQFVADEEDDYQSVEQRVGYFSYCVCQVPENLYVVFAEVVTSNFRSPLRSKITTTKTGGGAERRLC